MAAPTLKRGLWLAAAVGALAILAVAALRGERRESSGLDRYVPSGLMVGIAPERVTAVEVSGGGRRRRLLRTPRGWEVEPGGAAARRDPTPLVETGLRFLHGSMPQRVLSGAEAAPLSLAEAGLSPPRIQVEVRAGDAVRFRVDLGTTNPQGFSCYARVGGRDDVYLLSRYVAQAWQQVLEP